MESPDNSKSETRGERFKRIAEKRTKRILKDLRLLGNCANKSVYEYNENEVKKIFEAIQEETRVNLSRFRISKDVDFKL